MLLGVETTSAHSYRLVLLASTRDESLATNWAGVYAILASLARRELVPPDAAAGERMRHLIACKRTTSRPPGLDGALRLRVGAVGHRDGAVLRRAARHPARLATLRGRSSIDDVATNKTSRAPHTPTRTSFYSFRFSSPLPDTLPLGSQTNL